MCHYLGIYYNKQAAEKALDGPVKALSPTCDQN